MLFCLQQHNVVDVSLVDEVGVPLEEVHPEDLLPALVHRGVKLAYYRLVVFHVLMATTEM